jgi:hypothetical protein
MSGPLMELLARSFYEPTVFYDVSSAVKVSVVLILEVILMSWSFPEESLHIPALGHGLNGILYRPQRLSLAGLKVLNEFFLLTEAVRNHFGLKVHLH